MQRDRENEGVRDVLVTTRKDAREALYAKEREEKNNKEKRK